MSQALHSFTHNWTLQRRTAQHWLLSVVLASCIGPATSVSQQPPEPVIQLRVDVSEADQLVHVIGSRGNRPIVVRVLDEAGAPVSGATVTFRMPESGPRGRFPSGLPTEVLVTASDGTVKIYGVRWEGPPGVAEIRIVATQGERRAGAVARIHVVEGAKGAKLGGPSIAKPPRRWLPWVLVAAGAAAGGLALGLRQAPEAISTGSATAVASPMQAPPVQVGIPTITVGRP